MYSKEGNLKIHTWTVFVSLLIYFPPIDSSESIPSPWPEINIKYKCYYN